MIVIATHNGLETLPNLLDSIALYGCNNEKIAIVDTTSDDNNFIEYLKNVSCIYNDIDIEVYQTPYRGFDTGAYIYAYKKLKSEDYMFMQDSLIIKKSNWLDQFKSRFKDNIGAVAFAEFDFREHSKCDIEFIEKRGFIENFELPKTGIFGPIFYTKRYILDEISEFFELDNFIPSNKVEQQSMERCWAIILNILGYNIDSLVKNHLDIWYNDGNEYILKIFRNRY